MTDLVVVGAVALGDGAREPSSSEPRRLRSPTENVSTGRSASSAISATFRLESTPPDRNAPYGTSLIMRRPIDSRTSASRRARRTPRARGCRVRPGRAAVPVAFEPCAPLSTSRIRRWPGGSLRTPSNSVPGAAWRRRSGTARAPPRSSRGADCRVGEQCLDLGAEQQRPSAAGEVQRLDAERSRARSSLRRRLPRWRKRTCRAGDGRSRRRTPRTGAG